MSANLREQMAVLPFYLGPHLTLTLLALALGAGLSLPLAILAARRERLRGPALAVVGIIQTIPGLALLALMVPLLAALGVAARAVAGIRVPTLGFVPTVAALTLYSMLPMVRNTVTGLLEVDRDLLEAARGLGMTRRQRLWQVELPLALPVILAGVRTAAVWTVGMATLATPVGQACLGNYIFMGLQTRNVTAVLFGCVAAGGVALLLDGLLGLLERASRRRSHTLALAAAAALLLLALTGALAPALARRGAPGGSGAGGEALVVGSKTFTESFILARLLRDVLADAGLPVREVSGLGSTVILGALAAGDVDVYVDYTGTLWAHAMGRAGTAPADQVLAEVGRWLEQRHGAVCLGPLGFENAYALAMARPRASALGVASVADLAPHAPGLRIGGDYEFFGRPEWRALREAYGLRFAGQVSFDPTFLYTAVARDQVQVIAAFSSDGRLAGHELRVLDEPAEVLPPYDAVLLLSRRAASDPRVTAALRPLLNGISVETMREANHQVDRADDQQTVEQAARWLRAAALRR